MTMDLSMLAQRVAQELARKDTIPPARTAAADSAAASPRSGEGSAETAAPAGVRYARDKARIADFIDHTLLKADATRREVETLCAEAREHRFAAVCVNPVWVQLCDELLGDAPVRVATVIGFPLGANQPEIKAAEAALAIRQGADEVDMVAAIGHIKSADWRHVVRDIEAVVAAVKEALGSGGNRPLVKVIIESALLTPLEVVKASALARESGAQYVKTSTGFNPAGGATAEAVALMRLAVGDALGVKASGGVRDCETALRMIGSGATRIGTSSGVAMVGCLGSGPLPIAELLSGPERHKPKCITGTCAAPSSSGASQY